MNMQCIQHEDNFINSINISHLSYLVTTDDYNDTITFLNTLLTTYHTNTNNTSGSGKSNSSSGSGDNVISMVSKYYRGNTLATTNTNTNHISSTINHDDTNAINSTTAAASNTDVVVSIQNDDEKSTIQYTSMSPSVHMTTSTTDMSPTTLTPTTTIVTTSTACDECATEPPPSVIHSTVYTRHRILLHKLVRRSDILSKILVYLSIPTFLALDSAMSDKGLRHSFLASAAIYIKSYFNGKTLTHNIINWLNIKGILLNNIYLHENIVYHDYLQIFDLIKKGHNSDFCSISITATCHIDEKYNGSKLTDTQVIELFTPTQVPLQHNNTTATTNTNTIPLTLTTYTYNILELSLFVDTLTDTALHTIAIHTPNLLKISLISTYKNSFQISESGLSNFITVCGHNLVHFEIINIGNSIHIDFLDIDVNNYITYNIIYTISQICKKLQIFKINSNKHISFESIINILCDNCIYLHTISIKKCINLSASLCDMYTCTTTPTTTTTATNTTTSTNSSTDTSTTAIDIPTTNTHTHVIQYKHIQALYIPTSDLNDHSLYILRILFPNIHTLDISGDNQLGSTVNNTMHTTNTATIHTSTTATPTSATTDSTTNNTTDYANTNTTTNNSSCINNSTINTNNFINLTCIHLGRISTLTDKHVISIVKQTPLLQIFNINQTIRVSDVLKPNITDNSIIAITQYCIYIRELYIAYQRRGNITNMSVESLGRHCHNIHILDISGNNMISDSSIYEFSIGCSSIQRVHTSYCPNITELGVYILIKHCKQLERITTSSPLSFTLWHEIQNICKLACIFDDCDQGLISAPGPRFSSPPVISATPGNSVRPGFSGRPGNLSLPSTGSMRVGGGGGGGVGNRGRGGGGGGGMLSLSINTQSPTSATVNKLSSQYNFSTMYLYR